MAIDEGHAINIQIAHQEGLYRWSRFDNFCESFLAYLKAFYPTHTKFTLLSYNRPSS